MFTDTYFITLLDLSISATGQCCVNKLLKVVM